MAEVIPDWAWKRALAKCNNDNIEPLTLERWKEEIAFYYLAKCISEHEEPPVDPLLTEASNIALQWYSEVDPHIDPLLAALKRGIEIGRDKPKKAPFGAFFLC